MYKTTPKCKSQEVESTLKIVGKNNSKIFVVPIKKKKNQSI